MKKRAQRLFSLLFLGLVIWVVGGQQVSASALSNFQITIIPPAECYDGIDNDGDGDIDYPVDADCESYTDNSEAEVIPEPDPDPGVGGGGGALPPASASTVDVLISGLAYPGSLVRILQNETIVAETIAGQNAAFDVELAGVLPGGHVFSVYTFDEAGRQSELYSFPVFASSGATLDITGILLAPTISTDRVTVRRGDPVTIFGYAAPESQVMIEVNSEERLFLTATSDELGRYLYSLNSNLLEPGDHKARSQTYLAEGVTSPFGRFAYFEVGETNEPREEEVDGACGLPGDFNVDGAIDLVDFSIAAFWYKKPITDSRILRIENQCLNGDSVLNLTDLSIMAYYWTG